MKNIQCERLDAGCAKQTGWSRNFTNEIDLTEKVQQCFMLQIHYTRFPITWKSCQLVADLLATQLTQLTLTLKFIETR